MTTRMLPVDSCDGRTQTALHEAGHALAYIAAGLPFDYIDTAPSGGALGMVQVPERLIDAWTVAQVAMVGPVVEAFMRRGSIAPSVKTVKILVESVDEERDFAQRESDPDILQTDVLAAGSYALPVLVWALPFTTLQWGTIEAVAQLVLCSTSTRIAFSEVESIASASAPWSTSVVAGWGDALRAVEGVAA